MPPMRSGQIFGTARPGVGERELFGGGRQVGKGTLTHLPGGRR